MSLILSENYKGNACKLVTTSGHEVRKGDTVIDFRGDTAILGGGTAPHKCSSSGFVYTDRGSRSYPGVFNLKWAEL